MAAAERVININVGILGHVDSGKTSLTKALSNVLSTASLDKSPQSRERGITLDLGFSALQTAAPKHLQERFDKVQFTFVDCPGHASLIKTIIGGAQIIDLMLLVIDVTKGIQTQTAECLVIGEILTSKLIVVLNKVDKFDAATREADLAKLEKKLRQVFASTKFGANVPMVHASAAVGGGDLHEKKAAPADGPPAHDVKEVVDYLLNNLEVPERKPDGPFLFYFDHGFRIGGQGTVLTGTVISGQVKVGQVVEIPALKVRSKVKSMQRFHAAVDSGSQGDRLGICFAQVDPTQVERGIVCDVDTVVSYSHVICSVEKIRFFKEGVKTKDKLHISIGHATVLGEVHFFGNPVKPKTDAPVPAAAPVVADEEKKVAPAAAASPLGVFNINAEYLDQEELYATSEQYPKGSQFALIEFEKPVLCPKGCVVIGSRLDTDIHTKACRVAFSGTFCEPIDMNDSKSRESLKVYRVKSREGFIDRVVDEQHVIVKDLFKKETDIAKYMNFPVTLHPSGALGRVESSFGQTGKVKVYFPKGIGGPVNTSEEPAADKDKPRVRSKIVLSYKRYTFSENRKHFVPLG